jgi:hypothetical protein
MLESPYGMLESSTIYYYRYCSELLSQYPNSSCNPIPLYALPAPVLEPSYFLSVLKRPFLADLTGMSPGKFGKGVQGFPERGLIAVLRFRGVEGAGSVAAAIMLASTCPFRGMREMLYCMKVTISRISATLAICEC